MSIPFIDGFDHYNPTQLINGGRKWDQASAATGQPGRFTGFACTPMGALTVDLFGNVTGLGSSMRKTLPTALGQSIVGMAVKVSNFAASASNNNAVLYYIDGIVVQVSVWIDFTTREIVVRTGAGTEPGSIQLGTSTFVPPLTLWFYLEVLMVIGSPGSFEIRINGDSKCVVGGVQTQQSGNSTFDKIAPSSYGNSGFGGAITIDDFYILDPLTGSAPQDDFLGEVRVQTKYPDADGNQNDFLRSTGANNYTNANVVYTIYSETGLYNYSGTVGAKDLYSIQNFTVSGDIFAVQSNLSFRKDDVGNRNITPLLRASAAEFEGASFPCYSDYTYAGKIWENDPTTALPWTLTDLNQAEFGIKVKT